MNRHRILHGYFMSPLECSHSQRKARTFCKLETPVTSIAFPGSATITCPACLAAAREVLKRYEEILSKTAGKSATYPEVKRMVERMHLLIQGDTK